MTLFRDYPALRLLWVHCDQISDAGLEKLEGMSRLDRLISWSEQVTDAGLAPSQA